MFHRSCLSVICTLLITLIAASAQQPAPNHPSSAAAIPDTPAGHTFKSWLDFFNSADRAKIDAYIHEYEPEKSFDREVRFRSMTGGFVLLQIWKSDPLRLEFLVREQHGETRSIGKVEVKPGDPAVVADFSLNAIPPSTSTTDLNFKIERRHARESSTVRSQTSMNPMYFRY